MQSYLVALRAELIAVLAAEPAAFPEATISETSGCSLGDAAKETAGARTLAAAPSMADALRVGTITTGHVETLTRASRRIGARGDDLFAIDAELAAAARSRSIRQFDAYLQRRAAALESEADRERRLDRRRRATRLRSWTDDEGMWNLRGRFDPQLGVELARRLDAATRPAFAEPHTRHCA